MNAVIDIHDACVMRVQEIDMPMNLTQVLRHAGLSKATYDSRRIRGHHWWMRDSEIDVWAEGRAGRRNRYEAHHLASLLMFEALTRKLGVSHDVADYIVGNRQGDIFDVIENHLDWVALNRFVVGVSLFEGGTMQHLAGLHNACLEEHLSLCALYSDMVPIGLVLLEAGPLIAKAIRAAAEKDQA